MVEVAGLNPDELEQVRASPVWAPRVAAAHTMKGKGDTESYLLRGPAG